VAITPSGLAYAGLTAVDVGLHSLDGAAVDATFAPSSELPLHLAVYAATGAGAIVHTHSPAATALSLLVPPGEAVPPVHYYAAMFGGPIRVAPYHPFGTPELGAAAAAALTGSRGALLAHHGAVTVGADAAEALELAIVLEWLCDVYLRAAAVGPPAVLGPGELEQAAAALASYRDARPRRA
ncbi:class II aldolase/adducin family protein, partial [Sporichthya sp.]|uniref:class II aldolase/adducin family protein n=1 Tax=Sporichthya sp. TaxID=65475 RepID=UPI0018336226